MSLFEYGVLFEVFETDFILNCNAMKLMITYHFLTITYKVNFIS